MVGGQCADICAENSVITDDKTAKDTLAYTKGQTYLIDAPASKFNNQLFYCNEAHLGKINWDGVKSLDEANQTTISNGITQSCFTFFKTMINPLAVPDLVASVEADEDYLPFSKYTLGSNKDIIIDDDSYYQIMQVIGQPFIRDRELEYNRQAILKLAVEPALRTYYTYFPLIQEQVINNKTIGDYLIKYPEEPYPAYKAIAWITSAGLAKGSLNGVSPLTALATDVSMYTRAAAGSKFAQGLRYNKCVPGFTGETAGGSAYKEMSQSWPLANTLKNINRREKLSKVHLPDGIYAKGYSTLTGFLNIRWLCWSRNFDDVEFEDWPKVLRLCQSYVKFSIGSIRDLLRTDNNIPIRDGMQKEGSTEIAAQIKEWEESPITKIYTPSRGGMI